MNESSQEEGSEKDNISEYALQEAKTRFDDTSWERFHARDNATAKFYKERRSDIPYSHNKRRKFWPELCNFQTCKKKPVDES